MRVLLPLALLPLLAACSEQDMCIDRETRELRVVTELVQETQGNIARGYAIETYTAFEEVFEACGTDGSGKTLYCQSVEPVEKRRPKAIDLDAEQAKLRSLQSKQTELATRAEAAKAACIAAYPD